MEQTLTRYLFITLITFFLGSFGNSVVAQGQQIRKVLFLGNSYTGVNNLPKIVKNAARSVGDSLIFTRYTPGGYTLQDHANDPVSQGHIKAGGWDYVVLQGQSQEPVVQTTRFNRGAFTLQSLIHQHNPCSITLLYMTWGRKNGDQSNCATFPAMCTYASMDSALRKNYLNLASSLKEEVSPVSAVWRHIRNQYPAINLYQADESHPSKAGSYAAACSFYAALFKKDPSAINFQFGLSASDASAIQKATKVWVYDSLALWDFKLKARSDFRYTIGSGVNEVHFVALNQGVRQTYLWDFGDGDTSTLPSPIHSYAANSTYTVKLTTTNCDFNGTHSSTKDTVIQFCNHTPTISTTNPWLCKQDTLWTEPASAYQWFSGGIPIPETKRYLASYGQYNSYDFSVKSTVNGCAEISQKFSATPQFSGYFFDAAHGGDPCAGDTALFIVRHQSGILSATAQISWYKDGKKLPLFNDEDTLFITAQGIYRCKVTDPQSQCPFDTTFSTLVTHDCGSLSTTRNALSDRVKVFPNPASEMLFIQCEDDLTGKELRIYNAMGKLVIEEVIAAPLTELNIREWPSGVYYLKLSGYSSYTRKILKR